MSITPSSNNKNINDIVPGGASFKFDSKDLNPELTVVFIKPKISFSIRLLNPVNVEEYNMDVTFQNSIVQVFSVSQMLFFRKVLITIIVYYKLWIKILIGKELSHISIIAYAFK